jgi:hypothetical protein
MNTVTPRDISEREVKRALVVTEVTEDFHFLETASAIADSQPGYLRMLTKQRSGCCKNKILAIPD